MQNLRRICAKNCTPQDHKFVQKLRAMQFCTKRQNLRKNCTPQDRDFLQGLVVASLIDHTHRLLLAGVLNVKVQQWTLFVVLM